MKYPQSIERVVRCFSRFSGLGRRMAQRCAFEIVTRWDASARAEFIKALQDLSETVACCPSCNTHVSAFPCMLCSQERKEKKSLCIVSSSKDVYALEETGLFHGGYFVVGTLLSPIDQRGISVEIIESLKKRIEDDAIQEVIFAFDSSVEGDATVSFLHGALRTYPVLFSRLASGVPVGAVLEGIDKGTLIRAFSGRQVIDSLRI